MTYQDCVPLVQQLNHLDKLRLAKWLLTQISLEENIEDSITNETGLCGLWQDNRSSTEIVQEIRIHRTSELSASLALQNFLKKYESDPVDIDTSLFEAYRKTTTERDCE